MKPEEYREVVKKVKSVPLDQLIDRLLSEGESQYKNGITNPNERGFLCPFHDDHSGGHAGIYTNNHGTQKFHCFVCGETLDGIEFVQKYKNISFREAVLTIAVSFNLITRDEYKTETGKQYQHNSAPATFSETIAEQQDIAPVSTRNVIYRILAEGCKLFGSDDRLSTEDRDYLHSRGITDDEINLYGYFTMPDENVFDYLYKLLRGSGDENSLLGVPGFYREKKTGKIRMADFPGIGIPIQDHDRNYVALQIRNRNSIGPRYKFFSSSFTNKARYRDEYELGCGPSTPVNVVYPYKITNISKSICITEGTFKAAQYAEHFDATAISVQGVNNTRGVVPEINAVCTKLHLEKKPQIYIAYDMDMWDNPQVMKAAKKLSKDLQDSGFQVYYLSWNPVYKGLDDFLLARDAGLTDEKIIGETAEKWEAANRITPKQSRV